MSEQADFGSEQSKLAPSLGLVEARDGAMFKRYGYSRRQGQSIDLIQIPVALLEEALASMPDGDAHALLTRALENGRRA